MPTYDYLCRACGPFEARRPMSESTAALQCSACGSTAIRVPSAPRLNLMSSTNRYAETRNEKSAHEPDVVHTLAPHGHGHGHGHAHEHDPAHAHVKAGRLQPSHDPSRPWMLGH